MQHKILVMKLWQILLGQGKISVNDIQFANFALYNTQAMAHTQCYIFLYATPMALIHLD